jgi:hypothetical protein
LYRAYLLRGNLTRRGLPPILSGAQECRAQTIWAAERLWRNKC